MELKPNRKYDHAFAILRVDTLHGVDADCRHRIKVKQVVWSQAAATTVVQRLNEANADKGCMYFWQVTRVERKRDDA